ncbi:hypothetical protein C8F01DRAFT_1088458 [Mycena amicta]|nr:hypothetical protein C8F01DRAFT_1088458 [Mycena amicta]
MERAKVFKIDAALLNLKSIYDVIKSPVSLTIVVQELVRLTEGLHEALEEHVQGGAAPLRVTIHAVCRYVNTVAQWPRFKRTLLQSSVVHEIEKYRKNLLELFIVTIAANMLHATRSEPRSAPVHLTVAPPKKEARLMQEELSRPKSQWLMESLRSDANRDDVIDTLILAGDDIVSELQSKGHIARSWFTIFQNEPSNHKKTLMILTLCRSRHLDDAFRNAFREELRRNENTNHLVPVTSREDILSPHRVLSPLSSFKLHFQGPSLTRLNSTPLEPIVERSSGTSSSGRF